VEASGSGATATERLSPTVEFVFRDGLIAAQPLTDVHSTAPLAVQVPETTRYRVGPIALETPTARGVLAGLALVLAAAAGWCAAVLFGGIGLSEADQIAARYRAQLVDVSSATGPPGTVVLVGGIGELARLAKVDGSVILHERLDDGAHRYRVFMGSVAYEYQTAPDSAAGATRSDVAASDGIG
ncbi:MAG: hypothetical protein Q8K72_16375, partial [Acidimicrobiales bacterium]|nr:hypothetical protein [Acidimicrobiales bacterium]